MSKIATIKPYKVEGPVTIQIERTTRNALDTSMVSHGDLEVIDARTVRYHGRNFLEAWLRSRGQ